MLDGKRRIVAACYCLGYFYANKDNRVMVPLTEVVMTFFKWNSKSLHIDVQAFL